MVQTIGNPLSWGARVIGHAGSDVGAVTRELGGLDHAEPRLRHIGIEDLREALRRGAADFAAMRTDALVAALIYPVAGLCLVALAYHRNLLPLAFPLLSGFALVGPAAAVGLYEMSRRREAGESAGWADGFGVLASPRFGAILALALAHLAVFTLWIIVAYWVFQMTMGPEVPGTPGAFLSEVLTTSGGWAMMAIGIPLGLAFAVLVLATSLVSFPMLLDRSVGLPLAILTSWRVVRANPGPALAWGAVVVVMLALGALPFLLGLAITLPVLGHATWHLYRRAVDFG
ncbi:MAG: DUF2189 domain-containing protein [Rhodobacteraceae bacterium]|nr:DUF2189 domain-containing protein [Paracoccaceae bacterium]